MKKKALILSIGLLLGIIASFCINPVTALTPEGIWGTSAGDELYYKVTSLDEGSEVVTYAKVNVTKIDDSYLELYTIKYYYNFIYAITYVYTGTAWVESYPEVEWAGYNTSTFAWYGGYQVSLGFPNPAPLTFSWFVVNLTIYSSAILSGWGVSYSSSLVGDTLTLANATDSLHITYNTTTGICTNNTHIKDDSVYTKQEYLGEVDPFYEEPKIPGFNPIMIVSLLGITALLIGLKIKKK